MSTLKHNNLPPRRVSAMTAIGRFNFIFRRGGGGGGRQRQNKIEAANGNICVGCQTIQKHL